MHFGSTVPGKTGLSRASAPALAQFHLLKFSGYSTSIFLFFRSTESPGKTRSVFTPPKISMVNIKIEEISLTGVVYKKTVFPHSHARPLQFSVTSGI
jgi:hypothetical protein